MNNFYTYPSKIKDVFKLYEYIMCHFKYTSILDSSSDYDSESDTSRYTIIGVYAKEYLTYQDNISYVVNLEDNSRHYENWLDVLDKWTSYIPNCIINTPVQLGVIGYIGYEMGDSFEKLRKTRPKNKNIPDVFLVKYSILFVFDKCTNTGTWVVEIGKDIDICNQCEEEYNEFKALYLFNVYGDIKKDFTKEKYIDSIVKTVSHIKEGDIFQANITMRFCIGYKGDIFALYRRLREITPNPFSSYLDFDYPIISTSPERFFVKKGDLISSNPIKGTIKYDMQFQDSALELKNSSKNNAENVMIVDLVRNDLGRICEQGSVFVPALCELKRFNQIYHLESIISGKLQKHIKTSDILKALFPGGSITGAPKIEAMNIIEELEFTNRGPYCGTVGFFGTNGYIDTSINIRIIYSDIHNLYLHAGGGITVSSDAEDEYNELLLKVESLINTIKEFDILSQYRHDLDVIDKQIISLLAKRKELIIEISKIKNLHNIPVLQESRVEEMLNLHNQYILDNSYDIDLEFIEKLFLLIINYSMKLEKEIIDNETLYNSNQ